MTDDLPGAYEEPSSDEQVAYQRDLADWEAADARWQERIEAGEDPGPRIPPPAPPTPDLAANQGDDEAPVPESRGRKWWRRADEVGEAAACASCGCGALDACDTNLRLLVIAAVATLIGPSGSAGSAPPEFVDAPDLAWSERRALAALRWYKLSVSSRTPAVCTQPVSCSSFAARSVRDVGVLRSAPSIVRRLRLCARTARTAHSRLAA